MAAQGRVDLKIDQRRRRFPTGRFSDRLLRERPW
jgi:hypothetical protein